jgi:uncharacterized membrane protein
MTKAKLPLPLLILILATLFLLASTVGEWIGNPVAASRPHVSDTVEQQQAAIVYVRAMSWLSQLINHPAAHTEDKGESARPAEPVKAPTHGVAAHRLQLCALNKSSRPSTTPRKSFPPTLLPTRQSQSSRAVPSASDVLRDSSTPAGGS